MSALRLSTRHHLRKSRGFGGVPSDAPEAEAEVTTSGLWIAILAAHKSADEVRKHPFSCLSTSLRTIQGALSTTSAYA